MRGALTICKKEFLELSKDRKTLFFAFVMPVLLWPLIIFMMAALDRSDANRRNGKPSRIVLVDPSSVLVSRLKARPAEFELVNQPEGDIRKAIKDRNLELFVTVPPEASEQIRRHETFAVKVMQDGSERSSSLALGRLKEVLQAFDKEQVSARLEALHASSQLAQPSKLEVQEAASAGLQMGKALGSFLPYLLLMMMFSGSIQPGIYATAGEKERGTLQSLLSTRMPRTQIILGKLLYVFAMGVISAVVNLISMGFTFTRMLQGVGSAQGGAPSGLPMLTPSVLGLSFLLMIPLGLLFANVIVFMGIQAKNTQEAGAALMPGMFLVLFLGLFSMAPGLETMRWVPFVPVMNVSLVIRNLFSQQANVFHYLVAFSMTTVLAAAMTWVSARVLDRESAIFNQG